MKNDLKKAKKCLDIGTGSGWMTLAMAKMMEDPLGVVYSLDHI